MSPDLDYLALAPEIILVLTLMAVAHCRHRASARPEVLDGGISVLGLTVTAFPWSYWLCDDEGTRSMFERLVRRRRLSPSC